VAVRRWSDSCKHHQPASGEPPHPLPASTCLRFERAQLLLLVTLQCAKNVTPTCSFSCHCNPVLMGAVLCGVVVNAMSSSHVILNRAHVLQYAVRCCVVAGRHSRGCHSCVVSLVCARVAFRDNGTSQWQPGDQSPTCSAKTVPSTQPKGGAQCRAHGAHLRASGAPPSSSTRPTRGSCATTFSSSTECHVT
jgi:hypothetical protein